MHAHTWQNFYTNINKATSIKREMFYKQVISYGKVLSHLDFNRNFLFYIIRLVI